MAISTKWMLPGLLVIAIAPASAQRSGQPIRVETRPPGCCVTTNPGPGNTVGGGSLESSFGNVGSAPNLDTSGLNTGSEQFSSSETVDDSGPSADERADLFLEQYGAIENPIGHTPIIKKMYQVRQ